eukprot:scaffold5337_cov167-Amphora_coffeaeformis.AAC.6
MDDNDANNSMQANEALSAFFTVRGENARCVSDFLVPNVTRDISLPITAKEHEKYLTILWVGLCGPSPSKTAWPTKDQ